MLNIGSLKLHSNLILAPMAGISDLPFRLLCRSFGAQLAFIEMLNCRSISYKSKRTQKMLSSVPEDRPLGVQLLGCEENFILKALDVLQKYEFEILDFNAACPAKKVVRRGEGSSLMREPKRLQGLLAKIVKKSKVPVTLKIRSGWDEKSLNAHEVALRAQDAGVSAIFVHGRTKTQGYSGNVDYAAIRRVKEAVKVPVIASGDIFSKELVNRMLTQTGCDAVAVARGCLGNPWIFNGHTPDKEEVLRVMIRHLDSSIDFFGERVGVMKFRKFFAWYTKGFRKIRPFREKSSRAKTKADMLGIIEACGH